MSLVSCVHIPPRQEISILFVFLWFDGMNHWKHLAPLAVALSPATRWFNNQYIPETISYQETCSDKRITWRKNK